MMNMDEKFGLLRDTVEDLRKSHNMIKLLQDHDSSIKTNHTLRIAPTVCNGLVISIRITQAPQDRGQKITLKQPIPTTTWKADYGPLRAKREP
ncbi:hypothetical protein [uncultured Mediterranean phage]|nr:hypothetical protein [uncultured Mediterranean phage]